MVDLLQKGKEVEMKGEIARKQQVPAEFIPIGVGAWHASARCPYCRELNEYENVRYGSGWGENHCKHFEVVLNYQGAMMFSEAN
jgi:hypothetical protein